MCSAQLPVQFHIVSCEASGQVEQVPVPKTKDYKYQVLGFQSKGDPYEEKQQLLGIAVSCCCMVSCSQTQISMVSKRTSRFVVGFTAGWWFQPL